MNAPQVKEIPGMTFTGEFNRFHGQSLPVYAPKEPTNGRPSINTPEGWSLHRHEMAENHLLQTLGRQPTESEITEEMDRNAALGNALAAKLSGNKELPSIRISYDINGFVVDVTRGKGRGLCMPYDDIPGSKFICLVLGRNMTERQGLEFAKRCIETGKFGFFSDQKTI